MSALLNNSCLKKRLYITFEDADKARERCWKRDRKLTLRIYKCPFCTGFHLTHKPNTNLKPVKVVDYVPKVELYNKTVKGKR